jgi:hypothetical protein
MVSRDFVLNVNGNAREAVVTVLEDGRIVWTDRGDVESARGRAELAVGLAPLLNVPPDEAARQMATRWAEEQDRRRRRELMPPAGDHKQPSKHDTEDDETISAAELLKLDLPEPSYIIAGILTEGTAILAGKPKLGKSWLALEAALACAMGATCLGGIQCAAMGVLYLALEDNKRRIRRRLERLGWTEGNGPTNLHFRFRMPRLHEGGMDRLARWLDRHPDTGLVITDTLAKVRPPRRRDQQLYDADYEAISTIKDVLDAHDVSGLIVTHTRKMAAEDAVDMVSGTLGLSGAADSVLVLTRGRGQCDGVLSVTGRDVEEHDWALRWDSGSARWTLAGEAAEYLMSQERRAILDVLVRGKQPLTPTELAHALGKKVGAVKYLLFRMAQDGQVRNERGRYSPTESAG